ncbi:MAG: hypothetical protein ABIO65_12650 [Nitrospiria bacterium]
MRPFLRAAIRIVECLFPLVCLVVGIATWASAEGERIAVVVHPSSALISLKAADVRAIYLGERQFVGNDHLMPLHMPEGRWKTAFLHQVVGKAPKEYKLYWVQRVFQDGASLPKALTGPDAIIAEVAADVSSIGYVPERVAQDTRSVKVLFVVPGP